MLLALLPLAIACHGGAPSPPVPAAGRAPNIIVVFVDDMGYGDLSSYGNTRAQTPNIDRLAREGMRFTQFYVNSPICSPSRVAITTGMYPSRFAINSFLDSRQRNRARGMPDFLPADAPTLARSLRAVGYATGHFGKWHMGGGRDVGDAPLPAEYGFDESLTSFEGLGDRYLWRDGLNEQSAELGRGRIEWTAKHEMTRHYVDRAIGFIGRNRDRPFYLNLWPNDVHDEHEPAPGRADQYRAVARDEYERRFFAVLEDMDRQLGRLFDEVRRLGLDERTIILLTSDNGPTDWPRYYRAGTVPPGSSAPFRGRKWSLYEGGIRMPLIVRWPGRVRAAVTDSASVFSAIDLVPTLAGLAGAPIPDETRLDGRDVSPAFLGRPVAQAAPIFWYYPNDIRPGNPAFLAPELAVRDGRWKLLLSAKGDRVELYDLVTDAAEQNSVAERHPDLVDSLRARLLAWRAEVRSATGA